ncbi:DUF2946 family protein [Paracoccus tibetensis]|uniref:Uncharacterized protein n=1 Tax=Paracoccus tibetensis TaxID=336292 RepID=A0A1G5CGZ4_9RHOB|nr:hypothetical protein [Paracoccus tibetensis]SCY01578.1 hypothetical protein SAMN05660710_00557 [Paracoccus tibetensis]
MLHALRLCLLLGVILGVTLPKTAAALADLGLGGRTVVICTGHGLQEITLPAEGEGAPVIGKAQDCLLVHALTPAPPLAAPLWQRLIPAPAPAAAPLPAQPAPPRLDGFPRAPPRA